MSLVLDRPLESPADIEAFRRELESAPTEEIKSSLLMDYGDLKCLILRVSLKIAELRKRKEDTNHIQLEATYRRVAQGQVDPGLVAQFIGASRFTLSQVEALPMDDQKELAADPRVPVIERRPDGKGWTERKVDLTKADRDTVKLVIGRGAIRNVDEQKAYLGSLRTGATLVMGKNVDETPRESPNGREIRVRLTASEADALDAQADAAEASEAEIVRRLLRRAGAFKRPKT